MGTMVTLRVRLTMQPQHEPIRNFVYICSSKKRNRMKSDTVTLKTVPMIGYPEEIEQPHHGKMLQN